MIVRYLKRAGIDCTRCRGGQVLNGVCFLCSAGAGDEEPTTLERTLSNVTPEAEPSSGTRDPVDLDVVRERVTRWAKRIAASVPSDQLGRHDDGRRFNDRHQGLRERCHKGHDNWGLLGKDAGTGAGKRYCVTCQYERRKANRQKTATGGTAS